MSAICRRSKHTAHARGFTLVEILVVLLIMGLMASVAVPNLQRLYNSVEHDAQRETALGAITGLAYHAYVTGQPINLPKGRSVPHLAAVSTTAETDAKGVSPNGKDIVFPEGWQLDLAQPIAFNFLGICSGGKISLVAPDGTQEAFVLKGPRCDVALPPDTL